MYGWMDGWMDVDGCGLLLKALVFSLESSLSLFFRHGYPFFFSFFLVILLWHAIFSLFGATII